MKKALLNWLDDRMPLKQFWRDHLSEYYAPKNFNFWYFFGSLSLMVLLMQIFTGIFLTMHYKPDAEKAFASVELIMRDVEWGWLIRYLHSTGASAFFVVVYFHMFRALLYGSYKNPRELIWLLGVCLYLALMGEAFMGYLLPWGQMSYWGAQVIINLFGAIPFIGPDLATWIRGDFVISDSTLNRFFSFHVILMPLMILGLVFLHIIALHAVGSNNPEGVEIKARKDKQNRPLDGIPFHPYYTVKDVLGAVVFLILFLGVVFFAPAMGGYFLEPANFVPANQLVTPEHITPLWYFTPFYTILRSVPDPWYGVLAMGTSVAVLFFLPWIDRNPVKSFRYRSIGYKINLFSLPIIFFGLGYLGTQPVTTTTSELAVRFSELYLVFFFLMWFFSKVRTRLLGITFFLFFIALFGYLDFLRVDSEHIKSVLSGSLIPLTFLLLGLLLPTLVSKMQIDKKVPDRIKESG